MEFWPTGRRKKMVITALITLLIGTVLFLFVNLWVYHQGEARIMSAEEAPEVDAVLILGAYTYENGEVSPILRDRLLQGLELYRKGKAPKILVSGDHGQNDYDEVNAMRRFLEEREVPPEDIFLDHAGFDTYNSLLRARDIFRAKRLIVVTQHFHLTRAVYIGRSVGLECFGVTSDLSNYRSLPYLEKREWLARIKAFLEVNLGKKAKYGGDPHPISGDGTSTHDQRK